LERYYAMLDEPAMARDSNETASDQPGAVQVRRPNAGVLFPEFLDDYLAEDNSVRVTDVFVDELDLHAGVCARSRRSALLPTRP
jgi:hypothetical protein